MKKKQFNSMRLCITYRSLSAVFILFYAHSYSQDLNHLNVLSGIGAKAFYSEGAEVSAQFSGGICNQANAYFFTHLAPLEVSFQLLVLNKEDWPKFTDPQLIYGMPHYLSDGKSLVVAAEDNMFWRKQIPDPATLSSPYKEQFLEVYNLNGEISGRHFFDLLAVHELGHAWHWAAKLNTQRKWMGELFGNIMLHTYIAEERQELVGVLETLPAYWVHADVGELQYISLKQFEEDYDQIGLGNPFNYAWYQYRFHRAAKLLYDEGGALLCKKLWDFLDSNIETLSDEELEKRLGKEVHPYFTELIKNW
jgi:hypothetical protein